MSTITTEKTCTGCGETKPLEEFHRNAPSRDGRHPRCASCRRRAHKGQYARWTPEQRQKHRERVIRCRYSIEMQLVQQLFEQQEGCCAICATPGEFPTSREKGRRRAGLLCIDHDHETGKVRGLLCHNCNSGIGKLGDSVARLVKAAAYLIQKGGQ